MSTPSTLFRFGDLGITDRRNLNGALMSAKNATMVALLGSPRSNYNQACQDPENPALKARIVTKELGPLKKVRGLAPAVAALSDILADIKAERPKIYDTMGHMGMLCCRFVRGSTSAISNHSWGTAIDITLDGKLDARGDDKVQQGLVAIHKIFNRHGFFWGAAFRTEDAMHFEASEQLVRKWAKADAFGPATKLPSATLIRFGDRGVAVEELQQALNALLGFALKVDGDFGPATQAAVMDFQQRHGLRPDGVVGRNTVAALHMKKAA